MIFNSKIARNVTLLLLTACGAYWVFDGQSVSEDGALYQDESLRPSNSISDSSKNEQTESASELNTKMVRGGLSSGKRTSNERAMEDSQFDAQSVEEDFTVAFKAYPHLKRNYIFSSKAILSDREAVEWDKILSNPKNITNTLEGIKGHYNPDYDLQFSTVNQERIRFIKYASQLNNNPSSLILFEGIEESLLWFPDNIVAFPEDQKKSLIGDKAELIYIYEAFRPDGVNRLNEMAELNLKFRRVLEFARSNASHLNRLL